MKKYIMIAMSICLASCCDICMSKAPSLRPMPDMPVQSTGTPVKVIPTKGK